MSKPITKREMNDRRAAIEAVRVEKTEALNRAKALSDLSEWVETDRHGNIKIRVDEVELEVLEDALTSQEQMLALCRKEIKLNQDLHYLLLPHSAELAQAMAAAYEAMQASKQKQADRHEQARNSLADAAAQRKAERS